jgi:hypothetical protein
MKKHGMWSELKRLLNVFFNYIQEIERDNLQLQKPQRSMVSK